MNTRIPLTHGGGHPPREIDDDNRLLSIGDAAAALKIHTWALRRAVKRGDIPSYAPFNSRRFVKLAEVKAFIEASRQGGAA